MDGKPARSVDLADHEKEAIQHLCLLTMKPVIYVANVAESDLAEPDSNPHVKEVVKAASDLQSGMVTISAQVCCTWSFWRIAYEIISFFPPNYVAYSIYYSIYANNIMECIIGWSWTGWATFGRESRISKISWCCWKRTRQFGKSDIWPIGTTNLFHNRR